MENIFVEFLPPWVETGLQPAFYDKESGTVLQQTARMYARVNMLIRMFNKLSKNTKTVVEDYIEQFNELHDYVHDYFDNLDVQEEINNKLDDMTEAGTLQEIVADYLNSKAVFGFDTVQDMKEATNFVDGSYAETLGFFSKNDGGSALYKIRNVTNDDVVDERFIIEITGDPGNNLIAELVHGTEINVLQLGVTENNFSSIVNDLLDNNYAVYVPKGNYTAKNTIIFNNNDSKLRCDGNITISTVKTLFRLLSYRNIVKLNGTYTGDNQTDSVFMEISGVYSSNYNNIFIHDVKNFGIGIKFSPTNGKASAYNTINFDVIRDYLTYGILLTAGTGTCYVNENWITGGRLGGASGALSGIKTIKGSDQVDPFNGNVFNHICIDGHYSSAIDLEFADYNHFNDFRLSEHDDDNFVYINIQDDTSYQNYFSSKSRAKYDKIVDTKTSATRLNHFNIPISSSDGVFLGDRFKSILGDVVIERNDLVSGMSTSGTALSLVRFAYNSTSNPTLPNHYINGGTTVYVGHDNDSGGQTLTYTLPNVFAQSGVNSFYLYISYLGMDNDISIQRSDGTVLATRASLGIPVGTAISQKFFKIEFVGNIKGTLWKTHPIL